MMKDVCFVKNHELIFLNQCLDFDRSHFWDWTDFQSYIECLLIFSIAGGVLMYQFAKYSVFVETVGFLAVFTEAMLGLPQFLRNFKNRSTRGMK